MTEEELDRARAKEANRLLGGREEVIETIAQIAARLAREGWVPPDPLSDEVDWLIAENVAFKWVREMEMMLMDVSAQRESIRVAIKHGIEIGRVSQ